MELVELIYAHTPLSPYADTPLSPHAHTPLSPHTHTPLEQLCTQTDGVASVAVTCPSVASVAVTCPSLNADHSMELAAQDFLRSRMRFRILRFRIRCACNAYVAHARIRWRRPR